MDATHTWAAGRLRTLPSNIASVEFVDEDEYWYSEITCDPAVREARVRTHEPVGEPTSYNANGLYHVIDLTDVDFGALIREIVG